MTEEDKLITTEDLSRWIKVKTFTLDKWAMRGKGPAFIMLGNRMRRYRVADVRAWMEAQAKEYVEALQAKREEREARHV
ncbi:MAG: excisionase [Hyphomicrobium sp.]|nr:MAG: excisionase [Hyphomicrobium sp.]